MNFQLDEALLEPIARWWRFRVGLKHMPSKSGLVLADLGCGPEIRFFKFCQQQQIKLQKYYGIDPLISKNKQAELEKNNQISIVTQPLVKKINLPANSVDVVTAFAFLEHIDFPEEILLDAIRILKPGGFLILTTPTHQAKSILEFLAFRLGLISQREIAEHQNYFDQKILLKMVSKEKKLTYVHHQYFELGCNNLLVIKK
jgi:ubiquinone/menaquinone biosynthesis C-methylase UbiE